MSVSTESEQSAGQGYPAMTALRAHGIPVSLSLDSCVLCSGDLFSAMRTTLGAARAHEHQEAHARGETVTHASLHAEQVVEWATRGGARALGLEDEIGSVEVGKKADLVLVRNDDSPAMTPLLNPHGHVVLHAQRADVDTVLVDGRIVKRDHRLVGADLAGARRAVEATVDHLRAELGEQAWREGMNPEIPDTKVLDNPYTYTDYRSAATHSDTVAKR
ncbi:amidohydrolase [Amycolatopsis azurea DSM 43854]|uniref:Amidohydrolase n=1 Tax=Amycolatopsis azurea DSM 43854 TaxID=1238180 RepID=M2Q7L7_9PSEU|nr:amidohydrolase [Amycolatopsis azurea DSM 43854]